VAVVAVAGQMLPMEMVEEAVGQALLG
jgi:hypothetical protein